MISYADSFFFGITADGCQPTPPARSAAGAGREFFGRTMECGGECGETSDRPSTFSTSRPSATLPGRVQRSGLGSNRHRSPIYRHGPDSTDMAKPAVTTDITAHFRH